jgi:Mg/Co/Ni transporter MgtE
MNWKLIFLLSFFGILVGIASIQGFTRGIEWLLWLIIALICAIVISKKQKSKIFAHGLLIGLFNGLLNGIIQAAFFTSYLMHNPESIEGFRQSPINPQIFVVFSGPIIGLIFGCAIGLFAIIANKIGRTTKQNET